MRFLLTLSLFLAASFNVFSQSKTIKLVIDPGHGGSDPGHVSNYSGHMSEKEINLIISKKVGAYIQEKLQNVEIVYTREDDSYPTLDERVELANTENADYFIFRCEKEEDLAMIAAQQYYIEFATDMNAER